MVDVNVRKGSTAMADSNTQFRFILAFVPFPLFFRFGGSDGQDTGSHSYTSLQDTGSFSTKWKKVVFGNSIVVTLAWSSSAVVTGVNKGNSKSVGDYFIKSFSWESLS